MPQASTHWQASTFPSLFRDKISVIHDGIDTEAVAPNPQVSLTLNDTPLLTRQDEVITFVNRNLEPYRGYHTFYARLTQPVGATSPYLNRRRGWGELWATSTA